MGGLLIMAKKLTINGTDIIVPTKTEIEAQINANTKLAGIQAGAQVNVIETVKVNGTALTVTGKAVNIEVPEGGAVDSVNGMTGAVVITKTDVGLGNVVNKDTSNPANITQSASYRFVTDSEKATWNGKQGAITVAEATW